MSQHLTVRAESKALAPVTPWAALGLLVRSYWRGPYSLKDKALAEVFSGGPTATGVPVSEATAMNYSAVWQAVSLIAGTVASLPLPFYRRTSGGGKERYVDHPVYRLLHDEFNPEMTAYIGREVLQAHVLSWGNAYAEIERSNSGRPLALWPITPDRVEPFREGGPLRYRVHGVDGRSVVIPARDMLHIPGLGWDGTVGYSVIAKARESLGLGLAAERFGGKFFGNGSTFGGILSSETVLDDDSDKALRESIQAYHQGVERAHRFLILQGGALKYEKLGIAPNDAQFLETRQFQIEEVCRWFNLQPHKLKHLARSTNNNIEHQGIEFYVDTIRPWLVRWEQELNRKLVAPSERRIQFAEHVVEGLLRGDSESRAEFYNKLFMMGVLSPNDILELENRNPVPGGDTRFVPANMTTLERAIEGPPAPVLPPATTPPADEDEADEDERQAAETARLAAEANLNTAVRAWAEERTALERAHDEVITVARAEQAEVIRQLDEVRAELADATAAASAEAEAADGARADTNALMAAWAKQKTETERHHADLVAYLRSQLADEVEAREAQATLITTLTTERDDWQRRSAEWEADVGRIGVERDAALGMADALRADVEAAQRDRDGQAQRATDAEATIATLTATVTAHEARHAELSAQLTAAHATDATRTAAVLAAHRGLIVDVMSRMVSREIDHAGRRRATPEKLRAWLDPFYAQHADVVQAALAPVLRVCLAWIGSDEDAEAVAAEMAREHVETSRRALLGVIDASEPETFHRDLMQTFTKWEQRAAVVADRVMTQEIAHATRDPRAT